MKKIRGLHIFEHKGHKEMSLKNKTIEFLNPEYVYIPLVEQGAVCIPAVNVGDVVKVGQVVATKPGRFSSPMHASISGEVTSISQKMWHSSGKMVPTIMIKNDFKETYVDSIKPNDVNSLTKEDIVNIMKDCGIVGLGGSGFPTYAKYIGDKKIDVIIINAVECEPYISDDYTLIKERFDKVIEGIHYLMKASGALKAVIAIKKNKKALIELMNNELLNEENISLILLKDEYPAGWEKYIVQRVTKKTYNMLPSEVGAIVNNVGTTLAICNAVENNMPLISKLVTLSGAGLKNPTNVYVKIGTNVKDIIDKIGGYVDDLGDAYFIAGGPMTGKGIMFDTMVVNRSLSSVLIIPKDINEHNPYCLGCGKCSEHCPAFLSPIQIKQAFEAKDMQLVAELKANRCMQCGLCSYTCPSRMELTEAVGKAKAALMKK